MPEKAQAVGSRVKYPAFVTPEEMYGGASTVSALAPSDSAEDPGCLVGLWVTCILWGCLNSICLRFFKLGRG